jgi:radical SAM superfamily enzyme YgiQ (UPF0313 family)
MKILMISANTETINMPVLPLGMACVAKAVEDAGHSVSQLNLMATSNALDDLIESIKTDDPNLIGISVRNIDDQVSANARFLLEPVKGIVEVCRSHSDAKIILGGAGYSIFPQSSLEYLGADMGIQGEGERSFVQLVSALKKNDDYSNIPGLFDLNLGIQNPQQVVKDIDTLFLPEPNKHIWTLKNNDEQVIWLPIQSRRGCPMNCSYCSTPTIEGKHIRKRNIDKITEAMKVYTQSGFNHFFFVDNTFNLPPSYAKALCDKIIESGLKIKWRGILHPWKVDEDLVAKMADSGCSEISLGFESGSNTILKNMNKRFGVDSVRQISDSLKSYGIGRMGFLLFGSPGETKQTVLESLEFVDSLKLDAVKVTVGLRIYPYTTLSDHARKSGTISCDDNLLLPKFYIEDGLDGWIRHTLDNFVKDRPNWIY